VYVCSVRSSCDPLIVALSPHLAEVVDFSDPTPDMVALNIGAPSSCVWINTTNNGVVQENKMFFLTLETIAPAGVSLGTNVTQVVITEANCEWGRGSRRMEGLH